MSAWGKAGRQGWQQWWWPATMVMAGKAMITMAMFWPNQVKGEGRGGWYVSCLASLNYLTHASWTDWKQLFDEVEAKYCFDRRGERVVAISQGGFSLFGCWQVTSERNVVVASLNAMLQHGGGFNRTLCSKTNKLWNIKGLILNESWTSHWNRSE